MLLICHRKAAIKRPAFSLVLGPEAPAPSLAALSIKFAFAPIPNNNLFQKFIQTYIEKIRD